MLKRADVYLTGFLHVLRSVQGQLLAKIADFSPGILSFISGDIQPDEGKESSEEEPVVQPQTYSLIS